MGRKRSEWVLFYESWLVFAKTTKKTKTHDEPEGVLNWKVTPGRLVGMVMPPMDEGIVIDKLMSILVGMVNPSGMEISSRFSIALAVGVGVMMSAMVVQAWM